MTNPIKVIQYINALSINKIDEINADKIQRFKTFKYAEALYETSARIKTGYYLDTVINVVEDKLPIVIDGIEVYLKFCISYSNNKETNEHITTFWSYQIMDTKIEIYTNDTNSNSDDELYYEKSRFIYEYNSSDNSVDDFNLTLYDLEDKDSSTEELTNFILFIYKKIDKLSFDNYAGYFKQKNILKSTFYRKEVFKKFLPILDECCVCYCNTKVKTICGHSLCIICWKKLFLKNNGPICPICRNFILSIQSTRNRRM